MADVTIVEVLAALKTLEQGLTGIVTVFDDLPATIAPGQLPCILTEKIEFVAARLAKGVWEEVWTVKKRILAHTFPKQLPGLLLAGEALRRRYLDMIIDNTTLPASDVVVRSGEMALGEYAGVQCVSILLNIEVTLHRG